VIHCNTPVGGVITRLAAGKARKRGTKVYYTAHGFHFYKGAPKKNWIVFYPIEKIFSRMTDKLITITEEDYRLASEKFHCKTEHIHGVGVDEERYYPASREEQLKLREELGFTPEQKILLCIGELLPNKNQQMAIHAMQLLVRDFPDAQLLLAGNGPQKEVLEQEIVKSGLQKNVRMLGYCICLEKYQRITDVLLACSKREGLPLNLVEAMLSGTPVVASTNRGHKELVCDGETGFLVAVDDSSSMADRVIKLINDGELYKYIQLNEEHYSKNYGYTRVKKELDKIYFG
jgi:glycosyltransferase EpsD